jgi:hopanoid biosynthesis associated membrane protein HpnM
LLQNDPVMNRTSIPALLLSSTLLTAGLLGVSLSAQAAAAAATAEVPAAKPVAAVQDALIAVMKQGKKLSYQARYEKLDPVVASSFDFPFIARLVLGPAWDKLDADQRQKFADSLQRLSTSSYAKEFDAYSGQSFKPAGNQSQGGVVVVRYVFEQPHDRPIRFDYQVHKAADGQWKIANVVVDGVSDLALKRGQYRKLYAEKGFSGLIGWIDRQVKDNAGA